MATDRFAELGGTDPTMVSVSLSEEPEPEPQEAARSDAMAEFLQIKDELTRVEAAIAELKAAHRELGGAVFDAIRTRERAEELGDEIALAGQQVRGRLKAINDQLKAAVAEDAEVVHTTTHKMRQNMQMTATTKLVLLMGQYQDEQTAFKTTQQQTARRQMKLVKPDATEEELQKVADGNGEQIFTQMLASQAHVRQAAVLEEVQAKHDEIMKLEQGIAELHQLISDLATLIETQGEQLDSIEHHIANAKDYITVAVDELKVANEYATSSRKKLVTLTLIASGVGLAVVFPAVAPLVGSAQTAGTTGGLALLGSGVGVGAAKGAQGSYASHQASVAAAAETKKIKVKCPRAECAQEQRIPVPVSTNLHGRSWVCVECGKPFEMRQCANCFKLGTAPFIDRQQQPQEESNALLEADAAAAAAAQVICQRKGGTCGGVMSAAEVIVHNASTG
jgi:t-SNARE complex subunit (syntaxin)